MREDRLLDTGEGGGPSGSKASSFSGSIFISFLWIKALFWFGDIHVHGHSGGLTPDGREELSFMDRVYR
jgi:hypothetical protein